MQKPALTLHHGDCRDVLRTLPSDSLDSCCTDPPYALVSVVKRFGGPNAAPAQGNDAYMRASAGFMGKTWDTGETAFSAEFWAEVYRVLKPGAFVAAFGASRGYHRMACAIEDAGFEIRDSLMWVYGTGFPKSQDVSKFIDKELGAERAKVAPRSVIGHQRNIGNVRPYMLDPDHQTDSDEAVTPEAQAYQGFGTALKPAFEPICLARKPLSEGTVAANVLRWRTGALNIGASRVGTEVLPAQVAGQATLGAFEREDMLTPERVGRWPANVVHDGSDEVVGAFPTTGGGGTPRKATPNEGSAWAIGAERSSIPGGATYCDSGSAARFFYSAKASKADRANSKHPTVKPISLMEWLATLITPPGGTILDPFAGSGTTGAAARNKGFDCVLVEREDEYVRDIRARLGLPGEAPAARFDIAPLVAEYRRQLAVSRALQAAFA